MLQDLIDIVKHADDIAVSYSFDGSCHYKITLGSNHFIYRAIGDTHFAIFPDLNVDALGVPSVFNSVVSDRIEELTKLRATEDKSKITKYIAEMKKHLK